MPEMHYKRKSEIKKETKTTRRAAPATRNGSSVRDGSSTRENNVLLKTLVAFKRGNFATRMPVDEVGVPGKIADTLNEILELNQKMVSEFARISKAVGKDGKITQRASIGSVSGDWAACVESVNRLMGDLVRRAT